MSSIGAAPRAALPLSPARAEASRRNGAKSKGPKTAEGKTRSAQNALKHGLRAQKHIVLPCEDAAEFKALEAALLEELAPDGALQSVLAQRVVAAVWRLSRAERLEAELFERNHLPGGNLGLALIRDCNGGARSFDTLLRYRGGTLAELWRALRTLKALQAEKQAAAAPAAPMPQRAPAPPTPAPHAPPIEPEGRANALDQQPNRPAESHAAIGVATTRCRQDGNPSPRSLHTTCAALRPGAMLTPAPGWLPAPHR